MFERYTEKARRVIFYSRYEASQFGASAIETEHLLLGLLREDARLLRRFTVAEVSAEGVRRRFGESQPPRQKIDTAVELPLSPEAKRVLAFAHDESEGLGHRHIGTEHMLLGLLRVEGTPAARVLGENGVELTAAREIIRVASGGEETVTAPTHPMARAAGCANRAPDAPPTDDDQTGTRMKIEHVGIATPSLDLALRFWRDALGLEVVHVEEVAEQGVRVAMLPVGEPRVELLEPTGPDSPVAKFLEKRGAGIHHIAVRVPDIRAALARLKSGGARLIDEEPRTGAGGCLVAFVHPSSAGGVLLELVEHTGDPDGPRHGA